MGSPELSLCWVLTVVTFVYGFQPTRLQHLSRIASSSSFSATSAKDVETSESAIKALESLVKRQKGELKETERLLELLQSGGRQRGVVVDGSEDSSSLAQSLSAAASLTYGFDYGFISRSQGAESKLSSGAPDLKFFGKPYSGPPGNLWTIGSEQFMRNWRAIQGEYRDEPEVELAPKQVELRQRLEDLKLNTTEIWERELKDGPIQAPLIIKIPYLAVCFMLDVLFEGRYVPARFFLLETVARMPYFSYITMLHLYETLGFWRRSAEIKRIHFAEELNEYRHLLIMESLGGDQRWWVRALAQHSAIFYYIVLCLLWAVSPTLSYRFSELLETHAVNTYSVFLDNNEEELKKLPPSFAAVEYYCFGSSDPFYAEFQTSALSKGEEIRRPGDSLRSLYDVFHAIREDEGDHVDTMKACLDPQESLRSPSLERQILTAAALLGTSAVYLSTGGGDGVDLVGDVGATLRDSAVAGMAGLSNDMELPDLAEGGALLEILRRVGNTIVEGIEDILAALL